MNKLQAGFSRVDVTPPLGIAINGYFVPRNADKILDALEVNCVALGCGQEKVLLMSIDNLGIAQKLLLPMRQAIREATGLPLEAIYVHATHSHTAGAITPMLENEENLEYREFVQAKLVEAALLALADLQPARMGWGVGHAPKVAFVRRFRMKDGSVRTNPGTNHPDIVAPIGEVDERVNVLRFDRETDSLVLMNFGNHPDTVGGCNISADWPGFARRSLEQAIPGTKAIMFNGAQGDVNHINVHPVGGDGNDLTRDFDDVDRGYGHARHIGRVIAGAVLQVYDKVCYTDVEQLRYIQNTVNIPSNMPEAKDLHRHDAHYRCGRGAADAAAGERSGKLPIAYVRHCHRQRCHDWHCRRTLYRYRTGIEGSTRLGFGAAHLRNQRLRRLFPHDGFLCGRRLRGPLLQFQSRRCRAADHRRAEASGAAA